MHAMFLQDSLLSFPFRDKHPRAKPPFSTHRPRALIFWVPFLVKLDVLDRFEEKEPGELQAHAGYGKDDAFVVFPVQDFVDYPHMLGPDNVECEVDDPNLETVHDRSHIHLHVVTEHFNQQ